MATKRNIARSVAMGKSFYQSTKSKRARKTTEPQKTQDYWQLGTFMSLSTISKMETIMSRHRHRGGQLASNLLTTCGQIRKIRKVDAQSSAGGNRGKWTRRLPTHKNHMSTIGCADQSQKTTRDQKPQNDPHKNHKRSTNTKNEQNGL